MIETISELMDAVEAKLQDNQAALGLNYIGYGEDELVSQYPACIIAGGPLNREIHGTHTFQIQLTCVLWVYHADMTQTRRQRLKEDIELVNDIAALFHSDITLGQQLIYGYMEQETPGIVNRPGPRSVVGTRMAYTAISQTRFR